FGGLGFDGDALLRQVVNRGDSATLNGEEDEGRMLEYGGEQYDRFSLCAIKHEFGGADAELCVAAQDGHGGVLILPGFGAFNVETGLAIVSLLKCGVIAGELKLVLPLELKANGANVFRGGGWLFPASLGKEQTNYRQDRNVPKQDKGSPGNTVWYRSNGRALRQGEKVERRTGKDLSACNRNHIPDAVRVLLSLNAEAKERIQPCIRKRDQAAVRKVRAAAIKR